jgi:plastocyanin
VSTRSRVLSALGVTLSLVAGALAGCFSKHQATAPAEGTCSQGVSGSTVVVIRDFTFAPGDVRVRAGDRITWINCDEDQHTSTAYGGQWSSPLLSPGDGFTQTFSTVGEFPYHCQPHPFMTGRVIVD